MDAIARRLFALGHWLLQLKSTTQVAVLRHLVPGIWCQVPENCRLRLFLCLCGKALSGMLMI
jgi:hypothetical protein